MLNKIIFIVIHCHCHCHCHTCSGPGRDVLLHRMPNKLLGHQLHCGTDGRVGQGVDHLKNVSSETFRYEWPRSSGADVTE